MCYSRNWNSEDERRKKVMGKDGERMDRQVGNSSISPIGYSIFP
nr:hypothetical protein BSM_14900 [uncultured archaeon]